MTTLLHIHSSILPEGGASGRLARLYVDGWRGEHPSGQIIERALTPETMPHLTGATFAAFRKPAEQRSVEEAGLVAHSDTLIAEFQSADDILLGLPMYNFGIPSTLKAYFDHIARAGVTFRYTANGPEGLLTGKRAVVVATRGGRYFGTEKDTATRYVQDFLGFLGITNIRFVYAEGLAMGDDASRSSLQAAEGQLEQLLHSA